MLGNIWRQILKLHDPQLVADFQQFCGVDISGRDSGLSSANEDSGEPNGTSSVNPAKKDSTLDSNGTKDMYGEQIRVSDEENDLGIDKSTLRKKSKKEKVEADSMSNESQSWKTKVKTEINNLNIENYSMNNNVYFKVNNKLLYYIGHIGAHLGNESFLCYFFPYWFWNVDGYVCRRVILVWAFVMYVGQAAKDIICWPRPRSPPVAKLEKRYELEYGMPSTHAMVGFALPFSLFKFTVTRYTYSYSVALAVCVLWTVMVCFSRLYLGMHSVLDVLVGLLFSIIYTPLIHCLLDTIDNFQLTHPYSPIVVTVVALLLSLLYPQPDKWSTARSDTVIILGILGGMATASWLAISHNLYTKPSAPPPYPVKFPPDMDFVVTTMIRMTLGGTIMMATRTIMKAIIYRLSCWFFKLDPQNRKINKRMLKVELPCKFGVYWVVAFAVVYIAPWMFRCVGVERVTYFTDL